MTTVYAAPEGSPARLIARLALVVAVGIALLTPSTRAQGTKGVSLQPGQHGPRLPDGGAPRGEGGADGAGLLCQG